MSYPLAESHFANGNPRSAPGSGSKVMVRKMTRMVGSLSVAVQPEIQHQQPEDLARELRLGGQVHLFQVVELAKARIRELLADQVRRLIDEGADGSGKAHLVGSMDDRVGQ